MQRGEFELIDKIRRMAGTTRRPVVTGIGDDCAVIETRPGEVSVHTTDCLVEGVHFSREYFGPKDIGWKAVAVNLSDVAAMGARPVVFLLTLIVPKSETPNPESQIPNCVEVVRGALSCARRFGCQLAGGNISSTKADTLIVDVSMIGAARRGRVLLRSGARPGDTIYVAGFPGQSAAGLGLLRGSGPTGHGRIPPFDFAQGFSRPYRLTPRASRLVASHLRPVPMLSLGRLLAERRLATACIDTSDGLVQDLGHICEESGAGAEIDASKLPISTDLRRFCAAAGKDPLSVALSGGEDFGLVFTARRPPPANLPEKVTAIGRITRARGVRVAGFAGSDLSGFDHFSD